MRQLTMFDAQDQIKNLDRVRSKLMLVVVSFCREKGDRVFSARDLCVYCMTRVNCSPESPLRIFRFAEEEGRLKYKCLSRSKSLYKLEWVK